MSAIENPQSTPQLAPSPRNSSVPLLSETKPTEDTGEQSGLLAKGKRKLLSLGKKKEGEKAESDGSSEKGMDKSTDMAPPPIPILSADRASANKLPVSPLNSPPPDHRPSPRGSPRMLPTGVGASPSRRYRSSSPGLSSPASSQIFERNVQEATLSGELSPAIPAHIQTEDHIPPVLEASSLAITDDHLNPDEVEIVMHSAHQPASAAVAGSTADSVYSPTLDESISGHQDADESASNYGALDTTDVRRLSFISFADVVQAEHVESNRDATAQFMSLSSTANRSPSPVRSPASSHGFSASPPTSGATSMKGAELVSPNKGVRSPGSPTTTHTHGTHSPPLGGELQIETMRQALRKTGSGDLSHARSGPMSAVSLEDSTTDLPPFK